MQIPQQPGAMPMDVAPLPQPVNAFAYMAAQLRQTVYQTPQQMQRGADLAAYLDRMAAMLPHVVSREPLLLAAYGRIATDYQAREEFARVLANVNQAIAQIQAAPATAPNGAPNGQGYRIPPG